MNALHTESNLKNIVKYAKEVGPRNASLIARYTGIPPTTVRYSIRNLLVRRGIRFLASVSHPRLGLKRHLLSLSFDPSLQDPEGALRRMAATAYLEWYGKTLPRGDYYALVAVPPRLQNRYREFLEQLVESGFLRSFRSYGMDWFRLRSLDENDYNFKRGRWEVDWGSLDKRKVHVEEPPAEPKRAFSPDSMDLLIIKELELDATQRLSELARKLNLTYRTIYYHYTEHVVGQGLIKKYIVYPTPAYRSGEVTGVLHLLQGLSTDELVAAENLFHRVPFTWMDGYGEEDRQYVAYTRVPTSQVTKMFEFVSERMAGLREKYSFELVSLAHSKGYTIPYEMIGEDGVWGFDSRRALQKVVAEPPRQS